MSKTKNNEQELMRIHCSNREEWLSARTEQGIGASEAPAIVGMSPYETANGLWERKALGKNAKDISDNEIVARGVRMEEPLRELFKAHHPELTVEHYPYDILYLNINPWLFATLDGEITTEDGRKGILEIKTASPNGKAGWEKWDNKIPQNYYIQVLHQMLATDYDFVILFACLIEPTGNMQIREYLIEKEICLADMTWLLENEIEFMDSVNKHEIPKVTINF